MNIQDFIDHEKQRFGEENFSQKHFAELLGRSPSYVSKMASFYSTPSLMMALVIGILSDDKIRPKDLVTPKQFQRYLEKKKIQITEKSLQEFWMT